VSAYDFLIWREFEKRELGLAFSYGYWVSESQPVEGE